MEISKAAAAINICIDIQPTPIPVMVWGAPGIGKSDMVRQIADARKIDLIDFRLSQRDSVDLRGVPSVDGGLTRWNVPAEFPQDGEGILFMDEINSAPPMVQAAAYQLVLDRKLGDYTLPAGWRIVAAGNRETDRSVANRMPAALLNRFEHLEVEASLKDWRTWANGAGVPVELVAFLSFKTGLLFDFQPDQKAFPTPRSWAYVGKLLAHGLPADLELPMFSGAVGEGAAAEFMAFLRVFRDLPSVDTVLLSPDRAPVPEKPDAKYAIAGALAHVATPQNLDAIVTYTARIPEHEFGVLTIKSAYDRRPEIAQAAAFQKWAIENKEALF